jgi:hypothetical protein
MMQNCTRQRCISVKGSLSMSTPCVVLCCVYTPAGLSLPNRLQAHLVAVPNHCWAFSAEA